MKAVTCSPALRLPSVIAVMCVTVLVSCGGGVRDADDVVTRMIDAHGGPDAIAQVQSHIGRGFIKNLSSTSVVRSDPFDIYRRDSLYKNRIMKLRGGRAVDVGLVIFDGEEGYEWRYRGGKRPVASWQFEIMQYLFPRVLAWVRRQDGAGEIVTGEHEHNIERVRFTRGDHIVTIGVDDKTWLLEEVSVTSASDTAFTFAEEYGDYRTVDGVPFPGRYSGTYRGKDYYEYFIPVIEYDVELPDSVFAVTADDTIDIVRPDTTGGSR